jgi:hypothetical protein
VFVVLVPKLDGIREVELVPCSHKSIGERNGNIVKGKETLPFTLY